MQCHRLSKNQQNYENNFVLSLVFGLVNGLKKAKKKGLTQWKASCSLLPPFWYIHNAMKCWSFLQVLFLYEGNWGFLQV